jgi:hypothetical protein
MIAITRTSHGGILAPWSHRLIISNYGWKTWGPSHESRDLPVVESSPGQPEQNWLTWQWHQLQVDSLEVQCSQWRVLESSATCYCQWLSSRAFMLTRMQNKIHPRLKPGKASELLAVFLSWGWHHQVKLWLSVCPHVTDDDIYDKNVVARWVMTLYLANQDGMLPDYHTIFSNESKVDQVYAEDTPLALWSDFSNLAFKVKRWLRYKGSAKCECMLAMCMVLHPGEGSHS